MARRWIGDCGIGNRTRARQFLYCIQGQLADEHPARSLHRNTYVYLCDRQHSYCTCFDDERAHAWRSTCVAHGWPCMQYCVDTRNK